MSVISNSLVTFIVILYYSRHASMFLVTKIYMVWVRNREKRKLAWGGAIISLQSTIMNKMHRSGQYIYYRAALGCQRTLYIFVILDVALGKCGVNKYRLFTVLVLKLHMIMYITNMLWEKSFYNLLLKFI